MKLVRTLLSLASPLCALASAHALVFSDVDLDGQNGQPDWKFLSSDWQSTWSRTFDLLPSGFDPLTMTLTGATVFFAFADDGDGRYDFATITVGGVTLWNFQEVDGTHYNAPHSYDWYSAQLDDAALSDLQDGALDYSVQAAYGDFYLKEAKVVAEGERNQFRVPDTGATAALFSVGVVLMLILRRQMRSA